jgi:hypothetical protein
LRVLAATGCCDGSHAALEDAEFRSADLLLGRGESAVRAAGGESARRDGVCEIHGSVRFVGAAEIGRVRPNTRCGRGSGDPGIPQHLIRACTEVRSTSATAHALPFLHAFLRGNAIN